MIKITKGMRGLTTSQERKEIRAVGKKDCYKCQSGWCQEHGVNTTKPVKHHYTKLQYLKGSAKMGLRLWDVLEQVPGYPPCGGVNGFCTFSLETLKARKLI